MCSTNYNFALFLNKTVCEGDHSIVVPSNRIIKFTYFYFNKKSHELMPIISVTIIYAESNQKKNFTDAAVIN